MNDGILYMNDAISTVSTINYDWTKENETIYPVTTQPLPITSSELVVTYGNKELETMTPNESVYEKQLCVIFSPYRLRPEAIKKVIFNPPATIVYWDDGTKTVVKCKEGVEYNKWTGLSFAITKKVLDGEFKPVFKKWCEETDGE